MWLVKCAYLALSLCFISLTLLPAIGEPVRLEWFNPQGERIVSSKRMALHTESSRSRLIIYNAIIEDAGIYRCQATDANGHTEEASVVLEIYRKLDKPPRFYTPFSRVNLQMLPFSHRGMLGQDSVERINLSH